jgi:U11/U12 small nuclear ribonucleoprotein SNRNP35
MSEKSKAKGAGEPGESVASEKKLSLDVKHALVVKHNYEHVLDYGFYEPIISGSLDGSDVTAHDRGVVRAMNSRYVPNKSVKSRAKSTLFIGRLNFKTQEDELKVKFEKFGKINSIRLVRDLITGQSKGYAFVEFKHKDDAQRAYENSYKMNIDGRDVLVEHELERRVDDWKPRRLGGGLGGFKESGQLRFGGRYKPFGKIFKTKLNQLRSASSSFHHHQHSFSTRHDFNRLNRSAKSGESKFRN